MRLRDVPIKRKLIIVIMAVSTVVLLLTSGAFITYEIFSFRRTALQYAQGIGQIIAANSSAALTFDDQLVATEILSTLKVEENIVKAALYKSSGELLVHYPTNFSTAEFPKRPVKEGHFFSSDSLELVVPVVQADNKAGTLYLQADLAPVYERLRLYGIIVGGVMLGSFLIALIISNWLQKRISAPILELADTVKAVAVNRDYSVRARRFGADELGLLTEGFNRMLSQIHEREVALRTSEERLRLALNASNTGTWELDLATDAVRWDNHLYRLYGLKPGEFDGHFASSLQYIHPEDRAAVAARLQRAVQQGTEFIMDYRVIWPDQSVHHLASRGKAFQHDGKPTRVTGVTLDITESKEAAEALSLLAAIVESSDDGIVGKDLTGRIVSWNAGAERMFGYTAAEVVGGSSHLIVPPDLQGEEKESLQRILKGLIENYETVRLRKGGGAVNVSLTLSPIKNAEGKIIGVSDSSRDISDRIRAEEEIRILNSELEERVLRRTAELAVTNRELEAFTYSVSHDLRAPLRHIDAFAQMLQEETKTALTPQAVRYIERIRHGAQNLGRLVDDLLNLSRVGRLELSKEKVNLKTLVEDVLMDVKLEMKDRDVEFLVEDLPLVECDSGLIKQVFINLISNSIKYTRPRPKAHIHIGTKMVDQETVIFVRDNGVGFSMQYANKLFGVFQRLHRSEEFEGTGVGLATVQRIISLHGGRIWADAEVDKGATFYFTLRGI